MNTIIAGLGTAAPKPTPQQSTFEHAAARCCGSKRQEQVLERVYRLAGVASRATIFGEPNIESIDQFFAFPEPGQTHSSPGTAARMQIYSQGVTPLALSASRFALKRAQIEPASITHLITVSCTGFYAPGFDMELIKALPLSNSVARAHLGFMGCNGALNALRLASSIANGESKARILVCAAELCSVHFQYGWEPDQIVANSLFADGAAALVVMNKDHSNEDISLATLRGSGSYLLPDSAEAMTWRIGDHGFVMTLSAQLPVVIEEQLNPWMERWLARYGLRRQDIASWVVHPGGPRILTAVAQSLSLPDDALALSRRILREHGNMSSPTVLFALEHILTQNQQSAPCVVLGFGPGLTIEAALLTLRG